MEISEAINFRESIVALLTAEKLPVDDLPANLENFLVVRKNDELIGVIGLEVYGDYSLLRSLAVQPDSRSKGIAGKLLREIEILAHLKGSKAIYLLTETAPDYFNHKNYIKITRNDVPAEVQQSSEFSHVCPQSAIVMMKTLTQ
ncbi:MAG: family N-acetyltransferase [Mucilaginibacter sp.]|nr:family N-acetyltransferase [Mucilaginibacter sp.]